MLIAARNHGLRIVTCQVPCDDLKMPACLWTTLDACAILGTWGPRPLDPLPNFFIGAGLLNHLGSTACP